MVTYSVSCCISLTSNPISRIFQKSMCSAGFICFRDNVASKIENFQKLQPTLKNLKVKFDSKLIDDIMKEERGVALRLLY